MTLEVEGGGRLLHPMLLTKGNVERNLWKKRNTHMEIVKCRSAVRLWGWQVFLSFEVFPHGFTCCEVIYSNYRFYYTFLIVCSTRWDISCFQINYCMCRFWEVVLKVFEDSRCNFLSDSLGNFVSYFKRFLQLFVLPEEAVEGDTKNYVGEVMIQEMHNGKGGCVSPIHCYTQPKTNIAMPPKKTGFLVNSINMLDFPLSCEFLGL